MVQPAYLVLARLVVRVTYWLLGCYGDRVLSPVRRLWKQATPNQVSSLRPETRPTPLHSPTRPSTPCIVHPP